MTRFDDFSLKIPLILATFIFEPQGEKTNNVDSDQV